MKEQTYSQEAITQHIKTSIDNGWPLLAIDMIQIPEWGIITGYQKNGTELLCRTYYDQSQGYEIAQKNPWVVVRIYGKEEVDLDNVYQQTLPLALELYETKRFSEYSNGLDAIKTWISHLENEDFIKTQNDNKFAEICHANTWIYHTLTDTKLKTAHYLKKHQDDFGVDENLIGQFCDIYQQEAEILEAGLSDIAGFGVGSNREKWTETMRQQQVLTMRQYQNLETQAYQLLLAMAGRNDKP